MFYSLDLTTDDYLRWSPWALRHDVLLLVFFVIWYMNSYEPLLTWHMWWWTCELFKPMFIIPWLRMGRARERGGATRVLPGGSARRRDGDPPTERLV